MFTYSIFFRVLLKKHTTNLHRFGYTWNLNTWTPYVTNCNVTSPFSQPSLHLSVCLCAHLLELSAWSSVFLCASVCLWLWLVCFLMFLRFCQTSEWNTVLMWQLGKDGLTGGNRSTVFSLWHEKERELKSCVGVKCYSSYSKSSLSSGFSSWSPFLTHNTKPKHLLSFKYTYLLLLEASAVCGRQRFCG